MNIKKKSKMAGLSTIVREQEKDLLERRIAIRDGVKDLEALKYHAAKLVQKAKTLEKVDNTPQVQQLLAQFGLTSFDSSMAMAQALPNEATDYYCKVMNQLEVMVIQQARHIENKKTSTKMALSDDNKGAVKQNGASDTAAASRALGFMMMLTDLFCTFNRLLMKDGNMSASTASTSNPLLSPNDMLLVAQNLCSKKPKNFQILPLKNGSVLALRYTEDATDKGDIHLTLAKILENTTTTEAQGAEELPKGCSAMSLATACNISPTLASILYKQAADKGYLLLDESIQGVQFYPNWFNQLATAAKMVDVHEKEKAQVKNDIQRAKERSSAKIPLIGSPVFSVASENASLQSSPVSAPSPISKEEKKISEVSKIVESLRVPSHALSGASIEETKLDPATTIKKKEKKVMLAA
eukprot:Filipodium_phascolosomae@DN3375_c0_g1_i1.p1